MNGDLRVLIADDDSGMRMILRRLIEKADGFTLAGEASDGKQAIELAETLRPDVVFLDVEMPEMTGVECARVGWARTFTWVWRCGVRGRWGSRRRRIERASFAW